MTTSRDRAWWTAYAHQHPHIANLRAEGDPDPDLTGFDPERYIAGEAWRFAKTMSTTPHEYVMLHWAADPAAHIRMYYLILRTGYWRPWRKSRFRTLIVGDHGYWIFGNGVPPDAVINRAVLSELVLPEQLGRQRPLDTV